MPTRQRHSRLAALLVSILLVGAGSGCSTQHIGLDIGVIKSTAYGAPGETKPLLILPKIDMKDESWRETSIWGARVDPEMPEQLRAALRRGARNTSLFRDIQDVEWDASQAESKRGSLGPGAVILVAEMPKCIVNCELKTSAYFVSVFTLGFFPLFGLMGLPTMAHSIDLDWQLDYRLIDATSGAERHSWSSGSIQQNEANVNISWSNSGELLAKQLKAVANKLASTFATSFKSYAGETTIEVESPDESYAPTVALSVKVPEDPNLLFIDVVVNDVRAERKDAAPEVRISVDLEKGENRVSVVALGRNEKIVAQLQFTITRVK